jgi:hypothetical protein
MGTRPIQAQRVLIIAPEDTVSGSERPGMVMIDVALRKQPRATARGANPNATTPMVDSNAELKRALSSTLGA